MQCPSVYKSDLGLNSGSVIPYVILVKAAVPQSSGLSHEWGEITVLVWGGFEQPATRHREFSGCLSVQPRVHGYRVPRIASPPLCRTGWVGWSSQASPGGSGITGRLTLPHRVPGGPSRQDLQALRMTWVTGLMKTEREILGPRSCLLLASLPSTLSPAGMFLGTSLKTTGPVPPG